MSERNQELVSAVSGGQMDQRVVDEIDHGGIFVVEEGGPLTLETTPAEILEIDWKKLRREMQSVLTTIGEKGLKELGTSKLRKSLELIYLALQKIEYDRAELGMILAPIKDQKWYERFRDIAMALWSDTFGTKTGEGAAEVLHGQLKAERADGKLRAEELALRSFDFSLRTQVDVQIANWLNDNDNVYRNLNEQFRNQLAAYVTCRNSLQDLRRWQSAKKMAERDFKSSFGSDRAEKENRWAKEFEQTLPQLRMRYSVYRKRFPDLPDLRMHELPFLYEAALRELENEYKATEKVMEEERQKVFLRLLDEGE